MASRVESQPGEGSLSEFSVSPEAVSESEAPSRRANELVAALGSRGGWQHGPGTEHREHGRDLGRTVVDCEQQDDALAACSKFGHQRNTPFDFMVVDAGLERDEGFSLVAHFRDQTPYVERIVMMFQRAFAAQRRDPLPQAGISESSCWVVLTADLHDALAPAVLGIVTI